MKILTIGGYDDSQASLKEETVEFTKILGQEIIKQGHILVNACMTEFDAIIAQSALETCIELEIENSLDRIIGYIKDGKIPTHSIGRIRRSELKDWELGNPGLKVPEPIETADIVIIVSGFDGAQRAANWALFTEKAALHYIRYNVMLETNPLQELGFEFSPEEIEGLHEMSDYRNKEKLYEIGSRADSLEIKPEYLI